MTTDFPTPSEGLQGPAIRRALPADAAALAAIGRATFTETFGHLYPPQDLAAFLKADHTEARTASDLADPGSWSDTRSPVPAPFPTPKSRPRTAN
jgi:hypothetical protein